MTQEDKDLMAALSSLPQSDLEAKLQASLASLTPTAKPTPQPITPPKPPTTTSQSPADMLTAAIAAIAAQSQHDAPLDETRVREIATEVALDAASAASLDEAKLIELIKSHGRVARIDVTVNGGPVKSVTGAQHKNFSVLLKACSARDAAGNRLNIWIAGPAGTGKTSAAEAVAQALDLPIYAMGAVGNPESLVGYVSPVTGQYMTTVFRAAFETGGVMLLDEIDGSDANAMLILNQALANGWYQFPDGAKVKRHPDFVCIGAANTWGLGATSDYVGRFKADAAFLDRFVAVPWPIDEEFERALAGDDQWCQYVQRVRAAVKAKQIRVVISPRATFYGTALLAAGMTRDEVIAATVRKGMTDDQWASLGV